MEKTELQLITHSRTDAFKQCRKKHWFSYQLGIRPITDAKALRMGTAYHGALETIHKGDTFENAVAAIWKSYANMPGHYRADEWEIERETVIRMFCGYVWRWQGQTIQIVATEQTFRLPLINPATGQASRTFVIAGKIDGIIRLEDGRLNVFEHKLLGEDIGTDAPLWRRCRMDHQITLYTYAARQLGYAVEGVTYNVSRKPTIGANAIPLTDEKGIKVVVDAHGERIKNKNGTWKQTASNDDGFVLLTRPMTTNEWGEKLIADIQERPDYYYIRNEIPRLDADIEECLYELWDVAKTIRDAQIHDRWYRTVSKSNCPFCAYFNICSENTDLTNGLPEGFERLEFVHPELNNEGESNVSAANSTTASAEIAATSVPCAAASE